MTTVICAECGFDESRWTENDVVRTLAHADDLIGYVLEGADAAFVAEATVHSIPFADNPLASVHDVMHRLHDLAESRRGVDAFDPMVGRIESLQASGGGVPKRSVPVAEIGPGGVVGDTQGNRNHHGRPWQAICLYGHERIGELRREGHPIVAGSVGENLTISGIDRCWKRRQRVRWERRQSEGTIWNS